LADSIVSLKVKSSSFSSLLPSPAGDSDCFLVVRIYNVYWPEPMF
jgi:hypothetical protein